ADWFRRADYQQIALRPLGPEAVGELLGALLGRDASLVRVKERIRERAGGNPFFVEELVQSLREAGRLTGTPGSYHCSRGHAGLATPATVQSVLAARIDRLPEQAKAVLETAAVIGREFSAAVLQRATDRPADELAAALATLVRGEFVVEETLYPEVSYAFKHP